MSASQAPTVVAGKAIGPVGFGLMSLSMPWKNISYPEAAKVMKTALEQGANFWNGGQFYGTPDNNSLHLVKYYFTQYPEDADKVVLSIKGAFDPARKQPTGTPAAIRASVDECLRVLAGTKAIDVFEMARVDPAVAIETSVGALAGLVREGKIGGVGLSEVNSTTLRRAAAVAKIEAVEVELSMFTPGPLGNGVVEACRELDIPVIAYSPLGSGWLSGGIQTAEDVPAGDYRRQMRPRFHADAFGPNLALVRALAAWTAARRKPEATLAQVALAWVRRQGAVPLPGASTTGRVRENCQALQVELDDEDMAEIGRLLEAWPVAGARYGAGFQHLLEL